MRLGLPAAVLTIFDAGGASVYPSLIDRARSPELFWSAPVAGGHAHFAGSAVHGRTR